MARDKRKKVTKNSIRSQFAIIFIGLMAGTTLLCILVNNVFLGQYYIKSKTQVIFDAYEAIGQAANSDSYNSDEFQRVLGDICN